MSEHRVSLPGPHPSSVSVISPPRSLRMHLHSLVGCRLLQEVSLKDPVPGETCPSPAAQGGQASSPPWGCSQFHGTSSRSSVQLPITLQMSGEWCSHSSGREDQRRGRRPVWFPPCLDCSQALSQAPRWSPGLWSPPCCAPSSLHPPPRLPWSCLPRGPAGHCRRPASPEAR